MIILLYHHIAKPSPLSRIHGLYTKPAQFEWQIQWFLNQGYHFTTFETIEHEKLFEQSLRTAILTFDDGSSSIFNEGYPILKKFRVPAVLFPISSLIDNHHVVIPTNTDPAPLSFVTREQIRKLAEAGWEIGSHLHTHRPVTKLSDPELLSELQESKIILEQISGKPVISLAYPYGLYDERTIRLAKDCGYRFGLTTDHPSIGVNALFELPRVAVKGARWYHRYYFLREFGTLTS